MLVESNRVAEQTNGGGTPSLLGVASDVVAVDSSHHCGTGLGRVLARKTSTQGKVPEKTTTPCRNETGNHLGPTVVLAVRSQPGNRRNSRRGDESGKDAPPHLPIQVLAHESSFDV